jgi:hypothetical protein
MLTDYRILLEQSTTCPTTSLFFHTLAVRAILGT